MKVTTEHITHLLELIDDPNQEIVRHVTAKIIDQGEHILPELENHLHFNANGKAEIALVNTIIQEIKFNSILRQLVSWKNSPEKDLLEGLYILTKFQYPELTIEDLKEAIAYYRKDIWIEINPKQTSFELIKTFNKVFFEYFNFDVVSNKKATPFDYFFPSIFQQQSGSEIGIGLIYSLIAQELNIPVYGVIHPFNRFLLAYQDTNNILSLLGFHTSNNGILCYINVADKGGLMRKEDLNIQLTELLIQPKSSYFEPSPNTAVLRQYLENLYRAHLYTPSMRHKANYYKRLLGEI